MSEKIQLANDLLFSSSQKNSESNETNNAIVHSKFHVKNRVTFSSDIEEFGDAVDDGSIETDDENGLDDDEKITEELNQIFENDSNDPRDPQILDFAIDKSTSRKSDGSSDLSEIDDEECVVEGESANIVETVEEIDKLKSTSSKDDDEICEVIEFTTEQDDTLEQIEERINTKLSIQSQTPTGSDVSALMRSAVPQLIQSTGCVLLEMIENLRPDDLTTRGDEKLVAEDNENSLESSTAINSTRTSKRIRPTSARQKVSIKSASQKDANEKRKCFSISSECLKLQLNFKQCCEHKYVENEKLPRYTGYVSEYGLSKDQLDERELKRRMSMQKRHEIRQHSLKAKELKSQINEAAFEQWLKSKCKNARDKTKNMYDANINRGRFGRKSTESNSFT